MPTTFFGWVWFLLQKYGVLFLRGTGITMLVAVSGTLLGFLLGLLVAIARTVEPAQGAGKGRRAAVKVLHGIMNIYIQVFRGTPMIVQAMIIYYGAMQYLGITMNEIAAAVLIVSVNTGAYMAEIIRGGILSIDKGQTEAAHSIGLTHWQTMTGVVLPQAVRNILRRNVQHKRRGDGAKGIFHIKQTGHGQPKGMSPGSCLNGKKCAAIPLFDIAAVHVALRRRTEGNEPAAGGAGRIGNAIGKRSIMIYAGNLTLRKNLQLGRKIILKVRMLSRADVIGADVQEAGNVKPGTVNPLIFEGLTGNLHNQVRQPAVYGVGQVLLQIQRFGRGQMGFFPDDAVVVFDRG